MDANKPFCDVNDSCVQCLGDTDCDADAGVGFCINGQCGECAAHSDCTDTLPCNDYVHGVINADGGIAECYAFSSGNARSYCSGAPRSCTTPSPAAQCSNVNVMEDALGVCAVGNANASACVLGTLKSSFVEGDFCP
jgi:hypothetical protein